MAEQPAVRAEGLVKRFGPGLSRSAARRRADELLELTGLAAVSELLVIYRVFLTMPQGTPGIHAHSTSSAATSLERKERASACPHDRSLRDEGA